MDDDEEIQSHTSGSPSPSPPNGRITVTVAATGPQQQQLLTLPPPQQQHQNNNSLAGVVPIQQSKANGGGREDCWSEGATGVLIDAWGERYLELSRGNLKQKHWKEVADIVSSREDYTKVPKTDIQCKNRIDTVKKKYKLEKAKIAAGNGPSKWPFFERLDHLIGPTAKIPVVTTAVTNKVPVGIPVRIRSSGNEGASGSGSNHFHYGKSNQGVKSQNQNAKIQVRKRGQVETESSSEEEEEELEGYSDDSLPPREKKPRVVVQREVNVKGGGKEKKGWGSSIRMLTQAILKFGEAYEQAESAKLQQVVEMEKTRMKFAKELELQRMQFFMKTQMEISHLKHGRRGGNASNHHTGNHIINDNSDSDN